MVMEGGTSNTVKLHNMNISYFKWPYTIPDTCPTWWSSSSCSLNYVVTLLWSVSLLQGDRVYCNPPIFLQFCSTAVDFRFLGQNIRCDTPPLVCNKHFYFTRSSLLLCKSCSVWALPMHATAQCVVYLLIERPIRVRYSIMFMMAMGN
jgi:hypothetical protein